MKSFVFVIFLFLQAIWLDFACAEDIRVRKNVADYSAAEIKTLRQGVASMKALSKSDPSDPRGWDYQAAIHQTAVSSNANLWNQCEHGTRFFLSWHRMYLYFFERILRKASKDPGFSLPYWDYTSSTNQTLPIDFRQPPTPDNPLYEQDRFEDTNAGGELSTFITAKVALCKHDFDDSDEGDGFAGHLEFMPHKMLHSGVGGLMADTVTAAQDPIFFLHHANIDRLWESWLRLNDPKRSNPNDKEWLEQKFVFYDEDKNQVPLTGKQILDTSIDLEYRYDKYAVLDSHACVGATPKLLVSQEETGLVVDTKESGRFVLGQRMTTIKLSLQDTNKRKLKDTLKLHESGLPITAVIILDDLRADTGIEGYFEVYVNLSTKATPTPSSPEFLGFLSFFGISSEPRGSRVFREILPIDLSHVVNDNVFYISFLRRGMELHGRKEPPHFKGIPSVGSIKIAVK